MNEQKVFIAILAYILIATIKNPFIAAIIAIIALYLLFKKEKPAVLHGPNDHQWIVDNLKRNIKADWERRAKDPCFKKQAEEILGRKV